MGGHVDGFFGDVTGLLGHVRSGKLKPLGLASATRHPVLPDLKTLEEQGIPGVDTNNWYAIFAPAKTPRHAGGAQRRAAQGAHRSGGARPAAADRG